MKTSGFLAVAALAVIALASVATTASAATPRAFTYSIVARDPATGQMGVAVQSHWFSVGSVVVWAEAGVGAVATQSVTDPTYGAMGPASHTSGQVRPGSLEGPGGGGSRSRGAPAAQGCRVAEGHPGPAERYRTRPGSRQGTRPNR